MAEDNALDDFLTGAASTDFANQGNELSPRPKLKKIKRAKVRPTSDIPPAPEKIAVAEVNLTENITHLDETVEDNTLVNNMSEAAPVETTSIEENTANTSLVTAATAQDLTTADNEHSYMLNELPPELDYVADEGGEDEYFDTGNYVKKSAIYVVASVFLFVGLVVGKIFFSEQKIENRGLEGIVTNPDTPAGRPRCGLTDKNQACIFYILNWYKQELNGRDFYKLAAQLTGREEYMIESENMHYANVKIKPGHFAQLNIPALK